MKGFFMSELFILTCFFLQAFSVGCLGQEGCVGFKDGKTGPVTGFQQKRVLPLLS